MFESAHLKVERAKQHIDELDAMFASFLAMNKEQIFTYCDPEGGHRSLGITPLPAPPMFNILVGDIAHNLRSALDHIAGEITSLATSGCQKAIMKSKFPVSSDPEAFETAIATHIAPHNARVAAALVSEMKRSNTWQANISGLNSLNNADKHRAVVVVVTAIGLAAEGMRIGGNYVGKIEAVNCGMMFVNMTDQPVEFEKKPYPTLSVVFGKGEGFEGKPVIDKFRELTEAITQTIRLCAKNFTV